MALFKNLMVGQKYTTATGGAILMKIEIATEATESGSGHRIFEMRNTVVVEGVSISGHGSGTILTEDPMEDVILLS